MLFALLLLLMIALLDCSLLLSLLILCTAELSLFPLLVILNSSEFATRELNSWLLVKQILTTEPGTKLLLLSDEPLCFWALLEVFQMDPSSTELPAGSKSRRIDWLWTRSSSLSLRNCESTVIRNRRGIRATCFYSLGGWAKGRKISGISRRLNSGRISGKMPGSPTLPTFVLIWAVSRLAPLNSVKIADKGLTPDTINDTSNRQLLENGATPQTGQC